MIKQPDTLFYDIETTQTVAALFSMGQQYIRHGQLLKGYWSRTHIICITYRWGHEKKAKLLTWGNSIKDEKQMIVEFDKLVKQADVVIGKNSNRFDNKHINTQRLWFDLPGMYDWTKYTDDLEVHMRKNFNLQSNALDYLSEQLGYGGKNKMEWGDWMAINAHRFLQIAECSDSKVTGFLFNKNVATVRREGKEAMKKMCTYGLKDADDTVELWNHCKKHFQVKLNMASFLGEHIACTKCGGKNVKKNGTRMMSSVKYQSFYCNDCNSPAGRASILKSGKFGKMLG